MRQPLILCPLEIERKAAAKAIGARAAVVVTGPGGEAIERAMADVVKQRPPLVVLFGLAGGLRDGIDDAPRVSRVFDKDARSWLAPCVAPGSSEAVGVIGVDEPVHTPAKKKQLAQAYGAALVDCESHVFARLATEAGLRWAVVRGVSDGPDEALPVHASEWVDEAGKTRAGRVLVSTMLNPGVLPSLFRLGKRSKPALQAAAARLIEILNVSATSTDVVVVPPGDAARAKPVAQAPRNPIEQQLGRKTARLNDPPAAKPASSKKTP